MDYISKKSLTDKPLRRFVTLFITVIWLATVLQPCVMASVGDSSLSKIESHLGNDTDNHSSHINHGVDPVKPGCPHCETAGHDKNHCKSETRKICDSEDAYVNCGRIKPVDHEKPFDQNRTLMLLSNSDGLKQIGQLVASETGESPPPFQSPKLTDLYRVYLK